MANALEADGGTVYRAHLALGVLHPEIVAELTRESSEENEVELCLCEASFSVGPVLVAVLGSEALGFAGWLGLELSG